MAGASDISTILSQAGRIEKINQSTFAQSEVTKQILTEEEAQERLRRNREVNESKKGREIATKDREKGGAKQEKKKQGSTKDRETPEEDIETTGKKHIIDVVV